MPPAPATTPLSTATTKIERLSQFFHCPTRQEIAISRLRMCVATLPCEIQVLHN